MKKILYTIIVIFFIFAIGTLGCKFFGYDYYVVISDSMHPAIPKYSLVYLDKTTKDITVDDVIAFQSGEIPILHRVIDINGDIYTTHGDHNPETSVEHVHIDDIIGVMIFHIPYLGLLFLNEYLWIIIALVIGTLLIIKTLIKEMKNKGEVNE